MDYYLLGSILKKARENNELKQSDVAKICNVTPQTISVWEKGTTKIDIENLSKLCTKYNISCADLINQCLGNSKIVSNQNFNINSSEYLIIKKYRLLNDNDKETVDFLLNRADTTNPHPTSSRDMETAEELSELNIATVGTHSKLVKSKDKA